jgi:hypothetical protein
MPRYIEYHLFGGEQPNLRSLSGNKVTLVHEGVVSGVQVSRVRDVSGSVENAGGGSQRLRFDVVSL